eukprot:TRINITY_DN3109_c0_g1_i4.p1 TRINITY_DN3109_c0_g1~~TRINITY_DN3109_c0_g1_i4.p1  ORF type:complete len:203 (-),score=35.26 TRINITY_DN3109_c0_g1_i4:127-735(-)
MGAVAKYPREESGGEAHACKDSESKAHWSQASTATADELSVASSAHDVCSSPEREDLEADVAEYDTPCCVIKFQHDGPKGMDLLTVTYKPISLTPQSAGEALKTLGLVTRKHIHAEFATVFDISRLVAPSPFAVPGVLSATKENLVHLDAWREWQQAFSVVRGESSLFNAIVSVLASLSRAKNKPIFAKDQAEAYELLSQLP